MHLQSSATLGTGKALTHEERLQKEEHHEVKRVMTGVPTGKKRKRSSKAYTAAVTGSEDEPSDGDDLLDDTSSPTAGPASTHEQELGRTRATPVVIVDSGFSTVKETSEAAPAPNVSYIGSALKKAPDGSVVAPRVVKKAAKAKTVGACRRSCHITR